ncbi:DUF2169 domain-containing protein [Tabrizicola sp.]|uniref:DUF2169 family type VI secretion system accessory protein n=1 Tax=Tabrizicola sp. TaxID=2005166 RepID=UPI0035B1D7FD
MELLNPTPLPALAFRQFDHKGDLDCVVTLRGTFEHVQDGPAGWRDQQMPLQWQDTYEGDPQETPMLHQSDLVPGKPGTDVTFLGASFAPADKAREWDCRLEIGPVDKRLHVTGPRHWQPVIRPSRWPLRRKHAEIVGWSAGEAAPAGSVPMDWRLAAGGRGGCADTDTDADAGPDPDNPIGCGRIGPRQSRQNLPVPAPQISAGPDMTPAASPAGLGPIPPFWRPRHRHAGTYDEAWLAGRHPLLPEDFDPRFWQCAPEDQIVRPWLKGDESYRLTNLHPAHPHAAGRLPGLGFAVRVDDGAWIGLHLDGVQFDWRQEALILLTWRARFPLPQAQGVKLHLAWQWLTGAKAAA